MMDTVCISIVSHNRAEELERTLAVIQQFDPPVDEIRIHLDRCTDRSLELVRSTARDAIVLETDVGGSIPNRDQKIRGYLDAFQSIILVTSQDEGLDSLPTQIPPTKSNPIAYRHVEWIDVQNWDIAISHEGLADGVVSYMDTSLQNAWNLKIDDDLPEEVYYASSLDLGQVQKAYSYILDLGKINSEAEVIINTQYLPSLIHTPFRLDITPYLIDGVNTLEIWVKTPPWQNLLETPLWEGAETGESIPIGLLGPVKLYIIEN